MKKPVVIKSALSLAMPENQGAQCVAKKQKLLSWSIMDDWSFDDGFGSD